MRAASSIFPLVPLTKKKNTKNITEMQSQKRIKASYLQFRFMLRTLRMAPQGYSREKATQSRPHIIKQKLVKFTKMLVAFTILLQICFYYAKYRISQKPLYSNLQQMQTGNCNRILYNLRSRFLFWREKRLRSEATA